MKCEGCGGKLLETRLDSYHFDESGLEDVILVGVVERRCESCDEREVVIPKLKELHRTIAKALAAKNSLLTPLEVRFLRKHLGFSQADFAKRINVRSEAVSRWETGAEDLSWHFELLLRLMVMLELHERNYTVKSFDEVQEKRVTVPVRIFAEKAAWRPDSTNMLTAAAC